MYHNKRAAILVSICAALSGCNSSPTPSDLTAPEDPAVGQGDRASGAFAVLSDSWTAKPQLPTARFGHKAAAVKNIIYVVGGKSPALVTLARVDAFNLSTNTWSRRASLPGARWQANGASVIDGRIYVSGGRNASNQQTRTLFVYNPVTDTWLRKADMPQAGSCGTQGVIAGLLYVSTACTSSAVDQTRFYRYDPATNTWTTLASPPETHNYGVAGVLGGKYYLGGGESSSLLVYPPITKSWTRRTSVPRGLPHMSSAVLNGKLFVAGGFDADAQETNPEDPASWTPTTLRVYDPTTDTWHFRAAMPTGRRSGAGAAAGGLFFVIGGFTGNTVTRNVIAYTP